MIINSKTKKVPPPKPIATAIAEWKASQQNGSGETPPDDSPDNQPIDID